MKKISIITPCFNAADYIEDAIVSVKKQNYQNIEHIVVDGGSTDGTIEIFKKYSHLKWISERDCGQSDAMNKGFDLSTGDVIGYLNADDYYYPDIFTVVMTYFNNGAKFVQGKIKVERQDGSYDINDAKTTFNEIIRHWNPQAFCVNPVGYFYTRDVQKKVGGFDRDNHFSMDLQFLIGAAKYFKMTRIEEDIILGVFRYYEQTKTAENQMEQDIWNTDTFYYIDDFLEDMDEDYIRQYNHDRKQGYEMRKEWQRLERKHKNSLIRKTLAKLSK